MAGKQMRFGLLAQAICSKAGNQQKTFTGGINEQSEGEYERVPNELTFVPAKTRPSQFRMAAPFPRTGGSKTDTSLAG